MAPLISERGLIPGDDEANNDLLLDRLAGVPDGRRGAWYACHAALAAPDGHVVAVAQGTCHGSIGRARCGAGGFGYDPLFVPAGETRTTAEMSESEKNAISHRGRAFRMLVEACFK